MFLCKVSSSNLNKLFDSPDRNGTAPNSPMDFGLVKIGQLSDCSSYLVLVTKEHRYFERLSSIPEGYDFNFRQEWGLAINEDVINRVVATLRAEAYPPMSDYLDAKVKGDIAQEQAYLDACMAVKAKYPKFSW